MSLRIRPFCEIVRPDAERHPFTLIPRAPDPDLHIPPVERTVPSIGGGEFGRLFSSLVSGNVRTKPSYTDCWILEPTPDSSPISRYTTDDCTVSICRCPDGAIEYSVTPREYGYTEPLNRLVSGIVDDVRNRYRREGFSLDRDTVMSVARDLVVERHSELESACSDGTDLEMVSEDICKIVHRHSVGAGVFETLLGDPHIEDVYIDAPCNSNRIHVTMNGIDGLNSHMRCRTNLMADRREVLNLVNILKRSSGLRFCRSDPVLETDFREFDARATVIGYPMSPNGEAVAIRKHSTKPWTLSRLVYNGTIDARSAGLLSFLVDNRATFLVCGARGAGKSSLLSALMFEFPLEQRILTIEDTIELPGEMMRRMGYKVQSMLIDDRMNGGQPSRSEEALRVSLRMGESAIVLGEVRGDEARMLYQSMRTGRAGSSVMGTIHGDSAESVYKRVVHDMGISPEAFAATDVVVTLRTIRDRRNGHLIRRMGELVSTCEEQGSFIDITDPEALFASPVMKRVLQNSRMGRSDILKEIRARSMMRAVLADAGRSDESFLGPEWIAVANDIVSRSSSGETAETSVGRLRSRMNFRGVSG